MRNISLLMYLIGILICSVALFSDPFSNKVMLTGIFIVSMAIYVLQASKTQS